MGGKPSKEEFYDDSKFMNDVRNQMYQIQKESEQHIDSFFATVDRTVLLKGAPNSQEAEQLEKDKAAALNGLLKTQKDLAKQPDVAPPANVEPPEDIVTIPHKSEDGVIVILNQAAVYYSQDSQTSPKVLLALTNLVSSVVDDLLGKAKENKPQPQNPPGASSIPQSKAVVAAGAAALAGAVLPSNLLATFTTLFKAEDAVKAAVNGVVSAAKIMLSSLESQVAVSSSLEKKIQFIAPGMYVANYFSNSAFTFKDKKKTLNYNIQCGGVYIVTSKKLVQTIASLSMYRTICDHFERKLELASAKLEEYVYVYGDLAIFNTVMGFTEKQKNKILGLLKLEVMKLVVENFWEAYEDESLKDRTEAWEDKVTSGRFRQNIDDCKSAYEVANKDLYEYYQRYVKNPVSIGDASDL